MRAAPLFGQECLEFFEFSDGSVIRPLGCGLVAGDPRENFVVVREGCG